MKRLTKQAFLKHVQHRYWLRLHMFAILLTTTISGVLFSKILLLFSITDFRIRYPLSVALSYFVFFVCIKLWIWCITPKKSTVTSSMDLVDLPLYLGQGSVGDEILPLRGGGGHFSGGGASSSFEGNEANVVETRLLSVPPTKSGAGSSGGIGNAAGDTASAAGDDDIIIAVVALALLVLVILGSAVYVLYSAPAILSEAAFQGILATSLAKRTRTMTNRSWIGTIIKSTWKPFALTLGVSLISGIILHRFYPEAVRLIDILWRS